MNPPRLIVEVRWGKLAGTKTALASGDALTVGRTDLADLIVGHDSEMSGAHFELAWRDGVCSVRDLESISGTRLGGESVTEAEVPHGSWIQAGATDFMVYVEGNSKPPRKVLSEQERAREEVRLDAAHRALATLRQKAAEAPLYAVVDGARDTRILGILREHVERLQSLYDGLKGEVMEEIAPYLVGPMQPDSQLLDRLVLEGWGKRWGIWCTSDEPFVEVRRHWRRFLMVDLEESGERVYFRFYDPGVLRVFWGTCDQAQLSSLSADLTAIFVEAKDHAFVSLPLVLAGRHDA
ncbi:DUF4123 domain-containing protein [Chondromyces crocatus]|uniref:FHA domain-containing protein n=1 Tax=Chondromyces crocatus TaxID=52 RepID=A0A0K1ED91_CHOCO|nr:DUF4123 domain-containing protein [Chondromyces crocatus]AKT38846.1 uncharacterized protein CMC5_029920 [Chondromyces crocatus]